MLFMTITKCFAAGVWAFDHFIGESRDVVNVVNYRNVRPVLLQNLPAEFIGLCECGWRESGTIGRYIQTANSGE